MADSNREQGATWEWDEAAAALRAEGSGASRLLWRRAGRLLGALLLSPYNSANASAANNHHASMPAEASNMRNDTVIRFGHVPSPITIIM